MDRPGTRRLGIENLSTFGLHPARLVELAAQLDCGHVSLNLGGAANRLDPNPPHSLRDDAALRREVAAALAETGVAVSLLEGFALLPDRPADFAAGLDIAAELGARAICAVSLERDRERTAAEFARLAELAAARGIIATTEVGAGIARTLPRALELVAAVGHGNFRLLLDAMHLFRSGSDVADVAALDPGLIAHVQLCDVPMPAVIESYMEEALWERRAPGDGDLPLAEFLRAVPAGVPVGIEAPIRSEALAGRSDRERLARCLAQARALME